MARDNRALYAVAAAHLADLVTFYGAIAVLPLEREVNPIAHLAVATLGIGGVFVFKIAMLGGLLAATSAIRQAPDWVRITGLSFAVGIGLSGAAANLVALVAFLR